MDSERVALLSEHQIYYTQVVYEDFFVPIGMIIISLTVWPATCGEQKEILTISDPISLTAALKSN